MQIFVENSRSTNQIRNTKTKTLGTQIKKQKLENSKRHQNRNVKKIETLVGNMKFSDIYEHWSRCGKDPRDPGTLSMQVMRSGTTHVIGRLFVVHHDQDEHVRLIFRTLLNSFILGPEVALDEIEDAQNPLAILRWQALLGQSFAQRFMSAPGIRAVSTTPVHKPAMSRDESFEVVGWELDRYSGAAPQRYSVTFEETSSLATVLRTSSGDVLGTLGWFTLEQDALVIQRSRPDEPAAAASSAASSTAHDGEIVCALSKSDAPADAVTDPEAVGTKANGAWVRLSSDVSMRDGSDSECECEDALSDNLSGDDEKSDGDGDEDGGSGDQEVFTCVDPPKSSESADSPSESCVVTQVDPDPSARELVRSTMLADRFFSAEQVDLAFSQDLKLSECHDSVLVFGSVVKREDVLSAGTLTSPDSIGSNPRSWFMRDVIFEALSRELGIHKVCSFVASGPVAPPVYASVNCAIQNKIHVQASGCDHELIISTSANENACGLYPVTLVEVRFGKQKHIVSAFDGLVSLVRRFLFCSYASKCAKHAGHACFLRFWPNSRLEMHLVVGGVIIRCPACPPHKCIQFEIESLRGRGRAAYNVRLMFEILSRPELEW